MPIIILDEKTLLWPGGCNFVAGFVGFKQGGAVTHSVWPVDRDQWIVTRHKKIDYHTDQCFSRPRNTPARPPTDPHTHSLSLSLRRLHMSEGSIRLPPPTLFTFSSPWAAHLFLSAALMYSAACAHVNSHCHMPQKLPVEPQLASISNGLCQRPWSSEVHMECVIHV